MTTKHSDHIAQFAEAGQELPCAYPDCPKGGTFGNLLIVWRSSLRECWTLERTFADGRWIWAWTSVRSHQRRTVLDKLLIAWAVRAIAPGLAP